MYDVLTNIEIEIYQICKYGAVYDVGMDRGLCRRAYKHQNVSIFICSEESTSKIQQ